MCRLGRFSVLLMLLAALSSVSVGEEAARPAPDIAGDWSGTIRTPVQELIVAVRLQSQGDSWEGHIDIPQQGARGLVLTRIEIEGESIRFQIAEVPGMPTFSGKLSGDNIEGTFVQAGVTVPFRLERGTEGAALARPQQPEPPYPYRIEEVNVWTSDGVALACSLTLPEGKGRHPAVVLLTGSGVQDRDATLFEHRPFLVLADHLTRNSVATLRCDDRGVGDSGGCLANTRVERLADDALEALELLAGHPAVDSRRAGLIGHSAGATDAAIASVQSQEVRFLVLLAPVALPAKEILVQQNADALRAQGFDQRSIDVQLGIIRRLFRQVYAEASATEIRPILVELFRREAEGLPPALRKTQRTRRPEEKADQQLAQYTEAWFRSFLQYDPRATLKRVRVPVLALFGERDFQTDAVANQKALVEALADGGNERVEVEILPGLNHLFQPAVTGLPAEYGQIETTIDPGVLDRITRFVLATPVRSAMPSHHVEGATP